MERQLRLQMRKKKLTMLWQLQPLSTRSLQDCMQARASVIAALGRVELCVLRLLWIQAASRGGCHGRAAGPVECRGRVRRARRWSSSRGEQASEGICKRHKRAEHTKQHP